MLYHIKKLFLLKNIRYTWSMTYEFLQVNKMLVNVSQRQMSCINVFLLYLYLKS